MRATLLNTIENKMIALNLNWRKIQLRQDFTSFARILALADNSYCDLS